MIKTVIRDILLIRELFSLHSDFTFLPEREKIEKCEKLVCNIKDKEKYVAHIRALKQALNTKKGTQCNSI